MTPRSTSILIETVRPGARGVHRQAAESRPSGCCGVLRRPPAVFPSHFNDVWYENEDEATHSERLYHTSYVIWANYDVAGREQTSSTEDISTNFLGAEVINLIGAPLSDYQKAQPPLRESMPAIILSATRIAAAHGISRAPTRAATEAPFPMRLLPPARRAKTLRRCST